MHPIAVLGAGNSGLAMAAHLALQGHVVRLWNRYLEPINTLIHTPIITINGLINGMAKLDFVSTDMSKVMDGVTLVLVTSSANAHKDIAQLVAPYIRNEMLIMLNPGRTFGALEFFNELRNNGCEYDPIIVETQTIIYTCRKISLDKVSLLALKKEVLLSAIDESLNIEVINRLPDCLKSFFKPAQSIVETSIGNVGMILHCAPVLLNSGWIESPRTQFKYYYEGITPSIAHLLEKLDLERQQVAYKLGYSIESTADWLRRTYSISGKNLYECIQNNLAYQTIDAPNTLQHRYIYEDISCGLVPLEVIGINVGLDMRICSLIIDLATNMLEYDFRKHGRRVINWKK